MDSFRADLKPVLVLKGFLDASQDSPLVKLHHRNLGHKANAKIADPWAILMSRSDLTSTARTDVRMKIILSHPDLLWWWKVFDRP